MDVFGTQCTFLISDIRGIWHWALSAREPERQKLKGIGYTLMALNTSKCNHLSFKGLTQGVAKRSVIVHPYSLLHDRNTAIMREVRTSSAYTRWGKYDPKVINSWCSYLRVYGCVVMPVWPREELFRLRKVSTGAKYVKLWILGWRTCIIYLGWTRVINSSHCDRSLSTHRESEFLARVSAYQRHWPRRRPVVPRRKYWQITLQRNETVMLTR